MGANPARAVSKPRMPRARIRSLLCLWALGVSCHTPAPPPRARPPAVTVVAPPPKPVGVAPVDHLAGRAPIDLEPGSAGGVLAARIPDAVMAKVDAPIANLSAAETAALLARLEPLPDLAAQNAKAPALRAPSAPPARSGPVQPIAFAATQGRPANGAPGRAPDVQRPLAPPQILPTGEVTAESEIRIRFDEPMVAVAKVGEVAQPPATIAPPVAGTWRWLDSRVLAFTAAGARLPQATELVVTVAAGTRALSGAVLAEAATGTFATPPVRFVGVYPQLGRTDSAIALVVDQDVDAAKLAPFLHAYTPARKPLGWRFVDATEAAALWARNPSLAQSPPRLGKHVVYVAPTAAWPANSSVELALDVGAPSREGPRLTRQPASMRIRTVDTFHPTGVACDDKPARLTGAACSANGVLQVELSNPIAIASYRAQRIQIDGTALQDNAPSRQSVWLSTPREVGRTFGITIGEDLVDIYGQPFGGAHHLAFRVTPERFAPFLSAPGGMHVLDPRFETPQWVVEAEAVPSVRIQLFKVEPADYFAFAAYEQGKRAAPPGKRISDTTYPIGAKAGVHLRVDLRPALDASGVGHVIAIATTPVARSDAYEPRSLAWLQVTRLGVVARIDGEKLSGWVRDIVPATFLAPIPGAAMSVLVEGKPPTAAVASDADGHAVLELLPYVLRKTDAPPALLQVSAGRDSAFNVVSPYEKALRSNHTLWYITDDRFTYKPGEKVYVKGWVRWTHDGVDPDLALPVTGDPVEYTLSDGRGNRIASGSVPLSDQGGFDVAVDLPPTMNLGMATFAFKTKDQAMSWPISVQEFRTPAYAVTLNDDVAKGGAAPVLAGETLEMTAGAKYYAGGGLAGAGVQWDAKLSATTFTPAGWSGWTFQPPIKRSDVRYYEYRRIEPLVEHRTAALGGDSAATIIYGFPALPENRPSILEVDATVTDVDRMSIRASSRAILVHPSAYYVGLRGIPDTDDGLQAIVTDLEGNPVRGVAIAIDIEGVLGSERFRDDAKVTDTQRCELTSDVVPVPCPWHRRDGVYAYTAVAHVADARGRKNAAQYAIPWWTSDDSRDLAIIPDRHSYRPGQVAKLEIRSKLVPAIAIVTFARQGVIAQQRVMLASASTVVELPIAPSFVENVEVLVDRIGPRRSQLPGSRVPLPEHVESRISLPVELDSARLQIRTRALTPVVQPGGDATFEVIVKHDDQPVANAEVALIVVDEAILALSGRSHADPLAPFYRHVGDGTWVAGTLELVLDEGDSLAGEPGLTRYKLGDGSIGHGSGTGSGYGVGGGAGGMQGRSASSAVVTSRKDFRATAVFAPLLHTDGGGRVAITIKMPDSLTRFRIVALATAQTRFFGKGENTIITQRKINARTVAPRFLTQGDAFSLPVVVQNLDAAPRTIDVAVRAANLTGVGPAGKRVTVPGGQRAEVRFDFATQQRGRAVIQTIASSGDFADASDVGVPIYEPATTESFATYGVVDAAPQFEQLAVPASIFPDVGGVEVELASTQLQALTDAYWYLYAYPYECAEQRSSRMIATTEMIDILDAFATPGRPSRAEIDAQRAKDLGILSKDQLADGGWGYFTGMKADPYVTMQVLRALGRATDPVGKRAAAYVGKLAAADLAKLATAVAAPIDRRPPHDELAYRVSAAAAALSALAAAGVDVRARVERLHADATRLGAYPVDAKARLLALVAGKPAERAMRQALVAALLSATHETAAAATVTTDYTEAERLLLVSSTKTTALALDALIREVPEHALIPKLARGVVDARQRGRWSSTQDNLAVIGAMHRYFTAYEKATPNYTGKLWFGGAAYLEQAFVGRSNARATAHLDWTALTPGSTHDVSLVKDGPGRMYYRLGITYAPKQTDLPALEAGFLVHRTYSAVDDPHDVATLRDGRIKIRLGARVLVTLEALNTSKRFAVALVDPLPAGLEAVNDKLATAERAVATAADTRWDYRNMRDNRSEAFAMHLDEGRHTFAYTTRATTPGTFIAAPTKAEEMYSPETFGRSAGQVIVVE